MISIQEIEISHAILSRVPHVTRFSRLITSHILRSPQNQTLYLTVLKQHCIKASISSEIMIQVGSNKCIFRKQ